MNFTNILDSYNDVIISLMASDITSLTIFYSTVYSVTDQRKHQRSASLAFVRGNHRLPVNSPHKGPMTRKMFPFDDVIMFLPHGYCGIHATLSVPIPGTISIWRRGLVSTEIRQSHITLEFWAKIEYIYVWTIWSTSITSICLSQVKPNCIGLCFTGNFSFNTCDSSL